jgi:FHA domain-containing protein
MTQPRRTNSYSREPDIEGLDPSSAWVGDESAVIPPVAMEPYDWPIEEDKVPYTQVIPIPPPVRDSSARLRRPKRKAASSETSVLIPVEKSAAGQMLRKSGAQSAPAPSPVPPPPPAPVPSSASAVPSPLPLQVSELPPPPPILQSSRITRALPRPRRAVSSVLLLLLSVIAVFIFAYIAQK